MGFYSKGKKMPRGVKSGWGLAAVAALFSGVAQGYDVSEVRNGMLVPRVVHDGMGSTTAVGLVWSCPADTDGGTVYWTFFDVDSNHVTDGSFPMTQNDRYAFVWQDQAGVGLDGVEGYLVFVADSNNDGALTGLDEVCLAGEAFHVYAGSNDVAFVPVWPLEYADFNNGTGVANLAALTRTTVQPDDGSAAAGDGEPLFLMYSIGGGDSTEIVLWSAEPIRGAYTVDIYDHEQNRKSVSMALPNEELNVVDPSSIPGRPANFLNGFIRFIVPLGADENGDDENGMVSYSVIHAPAFGARQTIINPHID